MLYTISHFGALAALALVPGAPAVCSDSAAQQPSELLKTQADDAWKSTMVCCNGRCYRRRGPYYVEEYTNIRTEYDNPSKPKEMSVLATVRVRNVRDGWSPALPNQEIIRYRISQRSDQGWNFATVAISPSEDTSRIDCDQLAFLRVAQCPCTGSARSAYHDVGTRSRTAPRK